MIINGCNVMVVREVPRMQLSFDCPVTDSMREETNKWLEEFFGTVNQVPDGHSYEYHDSATGTTTIFMNQNTYDELVRKHRHHG